MNKVALLINNFSWYGKRAFRTWLPAVPIITAIMKNKYDFEIIDANVNEWDFDKTKEEIQRCKADLILISALQKYADRCFLKSIQYIALHNSIHCIAQ